MRNYDLFFEFGVPQEIEDRAILIMKRFTIFGGCDGMYISNVIARTNGLGDGCGRFNGRTAITHPDDTVEALQGSFRSHILPEDTDDLREILETGTLSSVKLERGILRFMAAKEREIASCEKWRREYVLRCIEEATTTLRELIGKTAMNSSDSKVSLFIPGIGEPLRVTRKWLTEFWKERTGGNQFDEDMVQHVALEAIEAASKAVKASGIETKDAGLARVFQELAAMQDYVETAGMSGHFVIGLSGGTVTPDNRDYEVWIDGKPYESFLTISQVKMIFKAFLHGYWAGKDDARETPIADLCADGSGKECREQTDLEPEAADGKEYVVSLAVDGRLDVAVKAASFNEAREKAEFLDGEYDWNTIEIVSRLHAVYAEDAEGNNRDFF